mmetsp:Transcript_16349/g.54998  ORF Transcript_16349/g.54998 Transcript_16349/m.54998 type:complete len:644 (-) Transcript_16349:409-2340(-)
MGHYAVTVPEGVGPGDSFQANCGGQLVNVTVPPGAGPGATVHAYVQEGRGRDWGAEATAPPPPPPPAASGMQSVDVEMPRADDGPSPTSSTTPGPSPIPAPRGGRPSPLRAAFAASPVAWAVLLLGLALCVVGKALAETNRPGEAEALFELGNCCGEGGATCSRFVGYYAGPDSVCPSGPAPAEPQSLSLAREDLGLPPGREYVLAVYSSTGASVDLLWTLEDAAGEAIVPPTRSQIVPPPANGSADGTAGGGGRRLAAAQAAASGSSPAGRVLLKGGFSGGGSGGFYSGGGGSGGTGTGSGSGSSGGGSSRTGGSSGTGGSSSRTGGSGYTPTRSAPRTGGGAPGTAGGSQYTRARATTSGSAGYYSSYAAARRPTRYGSYSRGFVAGGFLLGTSYRRRAVGSDTRAHGRQEETVATEDLDRSEVFPPSFSLQSVTYPLAFTAQELTVTLGPQEARNASNPALVFVTLAARMTADNERRFEAGTALWATGTTIVALDVLVSMARGFSALRGHMRGGTKPKTVGWYRQAVAYVGLTTFATSVIAAFVAVSGGMLLASILFIVIGLGVSCATQRFPAIPHAQAPPFAPCCASVVGLALTLVGAWTTDAFGLAFLAMVGVGMLLACGGQLVVWRTLVPETGKGAA